MTASSDKLFSIMRSLREANIHFTLGVTREDAVTIFATVPGQRWEIDVHYDGDVDVEVFRSGGHLADERQLPAMIAEFVD